MIKTQTTLIRITTSIMNLLDKLNYKTGLALMPALFFLISCEDPSEIGLDLNPSQGAISTHYVELPVESSQLFIDSVRTAVGPAGTLTRIGRNSDPNFGELTAIGYANIGAPTTLPSVTTGSQVDSAFLTLTFEVAYLGTDIGANQQLSIYSLPEPIRPKDSTTNDESGAVLLNFDYFAFDHESMDEAELIGQISFDTASLSTTVLRIPLTNAFASKILRSAIAGDSVLWSDQRAFDEFIGSLAIVPGEANTFINNYNLLANTSGITVHHSGSSNPLTLRFAPREREGLSYAQAPVYFGLEEDLSNTPLATAPGSGHKQVFETKDNRLYFRSGAGFVTRFDFPAFREFINSDTLGQFVINQAVLEIDSVSGGGDNQGVPAQLGLFYIDANNNRINGLTSSTAAVPVNANRYITNEQDTLFQYVSSQSQALTGLVPAFERYMQTEDENYLRGILYPSGSLNSLRNFIAEPGKVKLKIYYTSLKEQ